MLVNMAVWHTTEREDNQYLCLQVGGLQHHRCRFSRIFFIGGIRACQRSSLPQKQHEVQEVMCRKQGGLCPLTVASCRAQSQKLRHASFWSFFSPAHVTLHVKGHFQVHKNPEEFFISLSWHHSRAQRYQGPPLLSRNSTLRFWAASLSDPAAFSGTVVNCLPSL